jgi:Fe-S cluster biogenesis protein NfuA
MSTDTAPVDTAQVAAGSAAADNSGSDNAAAELDPRALTLANVERALDELRPYLMADGGNVEVVEIDGPIVKVRLQGACGSCPSSTMTLKMGIERKLREAIPEVDEVVQVL